MSWTFSETDGVEELKRRIHFLQSAISQRGESGAFRPKFVPWVIRLSNSVRAEMSGATAPPGTYTCSSNQWGAISVKTLEGQSVGIRPNECTVLHMTQNEHFRPEDAA